MNLPRKKSGIDVLNDIMVEMLLLRESDFVKSLLKQYHERGGLSKKQLQGLYSKAKKMDLPVNWLATLEAEILKKPTRYKSALPENKPLFQKDERVGEMINSILTKHPEHKRVIFFKLKFERNEPLTSSELTELEKFSRILKV